MTDVPSRPRTVLVSGASIAGPALAYWLHHHGFAVTVVEKASEVRGGGYAIDIRGTARGVVERMGLLPELRRAHVDTRRLTFLDLDGAPIATWPADAVVGSETGHDLEVRRGDLTALLYRVTRDTVEYLFDDSIATLDDRGDHVDVTFRGGARRRFDLVIGADGLHSHTRSLVMGPEEPYHRYLGRAFAGFTLPDDFGLEREGVIWNAPDRNAILYAYEPGERVHGFLTFGLAEPPLRAFRDPEAQRDLVASHFPDRQWEVPRLVAAMREADDLFFDVVSQIHLPTWSKGRVALAGDAAHAPSFLSGQGSSLALVGAYVLAGELAAHADHTAAFAAYEKTLREYVTLNQDLATQGGIVVTPRTQQELDIRNDALRGRTTLPAQEQRPLAYNALRLPDYVG
ncbi:FAD-dependent monooxygenase [Streptomyces sp. MMBL 11-3]|uniref:FAD-dependent monooxygenase n=1 Tax=Streptomyces sp. MMBL 11-3 TaxID=3382639 RepID=UPI0039B68390